MDTSLNAVDYASRTIPRLRIKEIIEHWQGESRLIFQMAEDREKFSKYRDFWLDVLKKHDMLVATGEI